MTDDVAEIDEVYDPYGKEEDEAVTRVDVFAEKACYPTCAIHFFISTDITG